MTVRRILSLAAPSLIIVLLAAACSGGGGEESKGQSQGTTAQAAAVSLTVSADTVMGSTNVPEKQRGTSVCVLSSRFPRNSEIVWRARVTDPASGKELDDSAIKGVQVQLADGKTFDMKYGGHPNDNPVDFFWTTSWDVPKDYPTGTVDYKIVATDTQGRTGTFAPFKVTPSLLTITDQVLQSTG